MIIDVDMQTLQADSTLQGGRYRIVRTLGQGGFGITYLAVQSGLEREVAIKEFYMKELCDREESTNHVTLGASGSHETVNRFKEKFLKEARNISRLNHPNIVKVMDVFEENGTAYYVMEYAEKGSLAEMVKAKGLLSESVATRYILRVADALQYIHERKMNHLDVKPSNILLNEKDEPVLIDFGLSKQYDATTGSQTSTTPVGVSEGYAPMEQYKQGGVGTFTPETDIYSLGATYFKLLTGQTPPSASDVSEDGIPEGELQSRGVSQKVIDVIGKAMQSRKKDRYKSVEEMVEALTAKKGSPARRDADDEATRLLGTVEPVEERKRMADASKSTLEVKAESGDAEAQFELAKECENAGEKEKAARRAALLDDIVWVIISIIFVALIGILGHFHYLLDGFEEIVDRIFRALFGWLF